MIETQSEGRRLSSITSATSLGQLADDVVLAALHWKSAGKLDSADAAALQAAAHWLRSTTESLADPLSLTGAHRREADLPGFDSFGPGIVGAVLGVAAAGAGVQEEVSALRALHDQVVAISSGRAEDDDVEHVLAVFEAFARAMLSAADALLAPAARATWAMTSTS